MNPCPKEKKVRNRKYLRWIDTQRCVFTNSKPCTHHHVRALGGGGTSLKPCDTQCVPVTFAVHEEMKPAGEMPVYRKYWPDMTDDEIKEQLRALCKQFWDKWTTRDS